MAILGQEIGAGLLKTLGLPGGVISFVLRVAVDEVVTVVCEYAPGNLDGLVSTLSKFELVPVDTPESFDDWMARRRGDAHRMFMTAIKDLPTHG